MNYSRRTVLASGLACFPLAAAFAQSSHSHHGGLYERLQQPGRIDKPEGAAAQNVFDSPVPKVDWHLVYDPQTDRWERRAPLPTGRDHIGALTVGTLIHVIGGRVNNFHTNSNLHHIYDPAQDKWAQRNPLPTARSGHGAVHYGGKIFVMGGEGTNRVFGQNEAYDPQKDVWEQYAPMATPRHGLGAVALGDSIYVAGGGPVVGGGVQSAVHEAFTLG